MNSRWAAVLKVLVLVSAMMTLVFIFPSALKFIEKAAFEARYLWWVILLGALGVWLIWGLGRKKQ